MKDIVAKSGRKSSYHFKNYYFMNEMLDEYDPKIPENMQMMQNIYRSKRSTNQVKSIHRVEDLLGKTVIYVFTHTVYICLTALGPHLAIDCLHRSCSRYFVNIKIATWHHYRTGCGRKFVHVCDVRHHEEDH